MHMTTEFKFITLLKKNQENEHFAYTNIMMIYALKTVDC